MGFGDVAGALVDKVVNELDANDDERAEIESVLADDPDKFLEKYGQYLSEEELQYLR